MVDNKRLKYIEIRGAREHNLKNIDIDIPKNQFVVITGLSGSGKSTLAFDTLYAEGQRRYVESLSSYARQFLNMMPKPDVDRIDGLVPAIAIEQKTISKNPRSTVGTITELYDFLRLLYAQIGVPISPVTGLPIVSQTPDQMVETILRLYQDSKIYILAPIIRDKKGEFSSEFVLLKEEGYEKVYVDGVVYEIDNAPKLQRALQHNIAIVIKCIKIDKADEVRLRKKLYTIIEETLRKTDGLMIVKDYKTGKEKVFSEHYSDLDSDLCLDRIEPRLFSFNNVKGACPECNGLGTKKPMIERDFESDLDTSESEICKYIENEVCSSCNGTRLSKESLSVQIDGKNIAEVSSMSITQLKQWVIDLRSKLSKTDFAISERILEELETRMQFLINVGLEYLTLSRPSETLSGGESQRIRLASQIGSGLSGVMYVLDEPSIGLHQRDNDKLIDTLKQLRDAGNSVIVVEHDEDTMRAADLIIDVGPKAGVHGGEICAIGKVDEIIHQEKSLTGKYLSGKESIKIPRRRRINFKNSIQLIDAHKNNLKHINVKFPLGVFTCVTGVSGSGKSTLVLDTLFAAVYSKLNRGNLNVSNLGCIRGVELIDSVIDINQGPIGRTPRSNPITYVGCFTDIRTLYAGCPESKIRGYNSSRFSFNIKGGRCETCKGDGVIKIEMHFLPDVYITCDQCNGKRFNKETLQVLYKGKNISEVLDMTIDEATDFFKGQNSIYPKLSYLKRVGLGYLTLGHKATILSGGEAQRIKLAKELSKKSTGNTLYILDEPTTGLHADDVNKLLEILQLLVEAGNSVIVIEHNMDVIKTADWVIDIGPEGGVNGGHLVVEGTPETVARCQESYTGRYLKKYLNSEDFEEI